MSPMASLNPAKPSSQSFTGLEPDNSIYKEAWDLDRAIDFIRDGRGAHFDPACVDAFLALMPEVLLIRERFKDE